MTHTVTKIPYKTRKNFKKIYKKPAYTPPNTKGKVILISLGVFEVQVNKSAIPKLTLYHDTQLSNTMHVTHGALAISEEQT
jgi:hypothetical protein